MCGICGEIHLDDGSLGDVQNLRPMLDKLRRRGPDWEGLFQDGPIAFGHRRLSILDLSPASHQPFFEEVTYGSQKKRSALVFNGTIYNFKELRVELIKLGWTFHSSGDTEVLFRALQQWGEGTLSRLDGMFAFAYWDGQTKSLILARDRFGIKPLYYSYCGSGCVAGSVSGSVIRFASSLPALLATGKIPLELDPIAMQFQFTLHGSVPAPWTILKNVKKVPPGSFIKIHLSSESMKTLNPQGTLEATKYWNFEARRDPTVMDYISEQNEPMKRMEQLFREAVRKRSEVSDVPVGVFLSGGLDSSLILSYLSELGHQNVHTFSIGFEDSVKGDSLVEGGNEFEFSDLVSKQYGSLHHKFLVSNSEVLRRLPEAVEAMSEPMFSQDVVAFYLLSERARSLVKVVQSGQGADEVAGGYSWYLLEAQSDLQNADWSRLSEEERGYRSVQLLSRYYLDRDFAEFKEMMNSDGLFSPGENTNGARNSDNSFGIGTSTDIGTGVGVGFDNVRRWLAQGFAKAPADTFMDAVFYMDLNHFIVDDPVKRLDNMTMAWGLEARVPFLDYRWVEAMMKSDPLWRLQSGGKYPLKEWSRAKGRLSSSIIDRPKGYFPVPPLKHIQGEFYALMRDLLLSKKSKERGLFSPVYVEKLLAHPDEYRTPLQGSKLWHMAAMELWLQIHLP